MATELPELPKYLKRLYFRKKNEKILALLGGI